MDNLMCPRCGSQSFQRWQASPFYLCKDCRQRFVILDLDPACRMQDDKTPAELFELACKLEWAKCRAEACIDKGVSL